MKKKFKDTKVGQFLTQKAPDLIGTISDIADDYFPPAKIITALFDKKEDIPQTDRLEFERLVREYEQNELKAYLADVADARAMQKEALKQEDKFSKRFIYYFTAASVILGFVYIYFITFSDIPEKNQRFADTILGVVISIIFGTIYNFFFGSSKSSQDKTQFLSKNMSFNKREE